MKTIKQLAFTLFGIISLYGVVLSQDVKAKQDLSFEVVEAKLKNAGSNAQILDARSAEEYKLNHIKGALDFSSSNDTDLQKKIDLLDKSKPSFVYSIGQGRSGVLAKKLKAQGFTEVYEIPGGFSKWVGSGKPVVSTTGSGLTLADYQKQLQSDKVVLVDFGSRYCPGCKKMLPVIDSLETENTSSLKVIKIEFFENKQLGNDLNIQALPTFILYKDGKVVWQKGGSIAKSVFEDEIKKASLTQNTLSNSVK